jgi:hypothetical protein
MPAHLAFVINIKHGLPQSPWAWIQCIQELSLWQYDNLFPIWNRIFNTIWGEALSAWTALSTFLSTFPMCPQRQSLLRSHSSHCSQHIF